MPAFASHQLTSKATVSAERLVLSTAIGRRSDRYTNTRMMNTAMSATASRSPSMPMNP